MWEINGILDQDPLSKFIVAIRVRIPSKKKTLECLKLTYILSCPSNGFWMEWDEVHHLWLNINHWFRNKLSQGESTLRPFRSLVIYSMIFVTGWVDSQAFQAFDYLFNDIGLLSPSDKTSVSDTQVTVKAHGSLLSSFDPKAQVIFFLF